MQAKSLSISEFKAHCTEELRLVAERGITLHITRHGKIVATVSPPTVNKPNSLKEWIGSGVGTVIFPPNYDPHAPAAPLDDWEALHETAPAYGASPTAKPKSKRKPR